MAISLSFRIRKIKEDDDANHILHPLCGLRVVAPRYALRGKQTEQKKDVLLRSVRSNIYIKQKSHSTKIGWEFCCLCFYINHENISLGLNKQAMGK